jgi:hypothetical protein
MAWWPGAEDLLDRGSERVNRDLSGFKSCTNPTVATLPEFGMARQ